MSVTAPRIRLISRALDNIPPEDVTLALSTRSLTSSYTGACVQVRREPAENALVFLSQVDGIYNDRLDSVAVSAPGEVYAIGRQRAAEFYDAQGTSSIVGANYGVVSPCLVKYASDGSPMWVSGTNASIPTFQALAVGLDGNVFTLTTIFKQIATLSVYNGSGALVSLPWTTAGVYGSPLLKYSGDGNVVWGGSVRSPTYNVSGRCTATDQASGVYIGGTCYVANSLAVSTVVMYDSSGGVGTTLDATGTYGIGWLGRYSASGNVLWATSISGATAGDFRGFLSLASDGSGGVITAGEFSGSANVLHSNAAVFATLTGSASVISSFLAKYSPDGTALAAFKATDTQIQRHKIVSDGVGNIYSCGQYNGRNIYHSNNTLAGQLVAPTGYAAYLVKYNSETLNAVWWTSVDGAQTDQAADVTADESGVYMTGSYGTTAGGTANIYHANTAVAGVLPSTNGGGFFIKYDPNGTVTSWSSTSSGSIEGIALDPVRNRAMVVGYTTGTANVLNQSGTVLSTRTSVGESGFFGAFQLGSTLQDIAFKRGRLDIDALQKHCPVASSGYVQTWYSQQKTDENPNMATATLVSGQRYELLGHFTDASDTYTSHPFISTGIDNTNSYRAFNKTAAYNWDCWHSAPGLVTNGFKWISFQYPHAVWLVSYTITARNDEVIYLISPYIWAFQGSNDGVNWTSVDSQSGVQFTPRQSRTFPVTSTTMYQYYRLYITSAAQNGTTGGANQVAVGNMDIATIETPLIIIEEYPPAPMTADTTVLAGQAYGNGTYVANASSVHNLSYRPWKAFDRNPISDNVSGSFWHSSSPSYDSSTGYALYTTAIVDGIGVPGEWLEIKLPLPVILTGYAIMPRAEYAEGSGRTSRSPVDFMIAGSRDGIVWTQVDTKTGQTAYIANTLRQFESSSLVTPYQYYRIIVSRIGAGQSTVNIGEWRLYSSYSDRNARQYVPENQPLLIENGIVQKSSTNQPLIDFSGGKSLVIGNDTSAAGTPTYISGTSGLSQSIYATTITSSEVIGVRSARPSITTNQQYAYGTTQNTLSSARATIGSMGSTPILDTLSKNAQTSCLAAFSFRKLSVEYTGPVVRLRRESDNAERDFYGSPSAIDTWIGTSSARVVTLWDQSGNEKHASQITPTNQPRVAKQFGVYVAHFNGTLGVPQFMTLADIYPASFWSQYYINQLNSVSYATLFARAGADYGFRRSGVSGGMTGNSGDFLGSTTDTTPYWIINGLYGSNNQLPSSVPLQVWNRVTGSRMTASTQPINQIGRGYTPQFRDLNGYVAELVFWSKPALVSDALLLDASPLVKTTSTYLSQTLNTTIGRLGALVSRGFSSVLDAVQIMSSFSSTSSGPRTGSGPLILNNQNFGNFQYFIKRGSVSINTGYTPTDFFSSVKDTAAAIVVIDGDLTIGSGCIFTPPVRKLFSIIYVTGNLVLDGEISMTARGANHNATPGESGFSSVFPAKDILVFEGEFGSLFGAVDAFVPANGGGGATGFDVVLNATGGPGEFGTSGNSGGGGRGGFGGGTILSGIGAAGTSFSGGTGGGGASQGGQWTLAALPGEPNGGRGGQGVYSSSSAVAGTFNFNLAGAGNDPNGPNGTGGTLVVICQGTVSGSGRITSHGSMGNSFGGGSGGGSAWLLAGSGGDSVKVTATGGDRAGTRRGLGGNGSAMKISLRNPSISTSTRSSVVGAYSLRRLFGGWGGPVVRVRHGTTNEQRNFYAEDLEAGAALDTFLGGAIAYIHTWYDQSGSNNHASQTVTTSQPWIVRDASWTTQPTVRSGGVGFLNYNGAGLVSTNYTVAISTARTSNVANYFMTGTSNTADQNLTLGYRTDTQLTHTQYGSVYNMTISGYTSAIPETIVFRHSSTVGKTTHRNGTLLGSSVNVEPLTAYVGAAIGRSYDGDISEVVLLSSYVPDSERSLLEASMMSAL